LLEKACALKKEPILSAPQSNAYLRMFGLWRIYRPVRITPKIRRLDKKYSLYQIDIFARKDKITWLCECKYRS